MNLTKKETPFTYWNAEASNGFVQYTEKLKYDRFERIMNTKEYLTQEEYDFCLEWDNDIKMDTSYIGDYSKYGAYLNLRVYSEAGNYNGDECIN